IAFAPGAVAGQWTPILIDEKNAGSIQVDRSRGVLFWRQEAVERVFRFSLITEDPLQLRIRVPGKSIAELYRITTSPHVPGMEGRLSAAQNRPQVLKSPMTGKVFKILCKEGDEVTSETDLLVIEAMKMENRIKSD